MSISVMIVDDEKAGRTLIREYLTAYEGFEIIGEAMNGVEAVQSIEANNPDLVFLDIQMPGLNGFEVLSHLTSFPQVIFSTAYDQYAIKAFEVHAVDYLLKPYTEERFKKAMHKLLARQYDATPLPLIESLLQKDQLYPEQVLVPKGNRWISLKMDDIYWIQAYGDYSKIYTKDQVYTSNHGISSLEQRLSPNIFLRVHRSSIIHVGKIDSILTKGSQQKALLQNQLMVPISRRYKSKLKERLI